MESDKLDRKLVLHVANLARLDVTEEEIVKYQTQLKNILDEIDKINKVDINSDEILITPTTNLNKYREDVVGNMLTKEEALKNANKTNGDFIEVLGVLNE
jgi:aspartyl-tRNA(Asn)/glutamyl-tRNA(Gln) amidotransferase subunit C